MRTEPRPSRAILGAVMAWLVWSLFTVCWLWLWPEEVDLSRGLGWAIGGSAVAFGVAAAAGVPFALLGARYVRDHPDGGTESEFVQAVGVLGLGVPVGLQIVTFLVLSQAQFLVTRVELRSALGAVLGAVVGMGLMGSLYGRMEWKRRRAKALSASASEGAG